MDGRPGRSQNMFLALLHAPRTHPLIIAHRGDSFHAPENTLEAARLAGRPAPPPGSSTSS